MPRLDDQRFVVFIAWVKGGVGRKDRRAMLVEVLVNVPLLKIYYEDTTPASDKPF